MAGALEKRRHRAAAHGADQGVGPLGLVVLVIGGAVLGFLLKEIDGGPRTPDWAHIREVLAGSELADADVIAGAATIAWLTLGYLALTVGLRLLLLLADRTSGGARWARTGLQLSNLITIPAVRRVVDGGVAGTLLVSSWLPASSRIAGAADPAFIVALAPPLRPLAASADGPLWRLEIEPQQESPRFVEYTVLRGDYLWDIARHLYGDGSRFVEIFEANRGRVMPGGEAFSDPRLIRAGWVLRVPLPALNLRLEDGVATYQVRRGDHLWGIAERFLGDGDRWVEIWELNRGRDMQGGWRFSDPNLIYPGWLLELPLAIGEGASPVETPAPTEPTATPAASGPAEIPATASPETVEVDGTDATDDAASGGWDWEWPSLPRPVVVTAAGFAVIGGTALFVQRLHRAGALRLHRDADRRGSDPGDAGRVALATKALAAALADYGFADSTPLLVLEAGRRLEFTVACPAGDAEALVALRHDLARRLACDVDAELIGSARVTLTLSGFQRLAGLLAGESTAPPALVVPVGADTRGVVYVNLAAAGSVAVAGTAGERRRLLHSWLATLSTTCSPEELSFRVESEAARLLETDMGLPHFAGTSGEYDAADLADELDETVQSRGLGGNMGHPLVAIFDLAEAGGELPGAALQHGPPGGVFVICCVPTGEPPDRLGGFGATLAFGATGDGSDDDDGTPLGTIVLSIGRDEPLLLEPVHVRRDTSRRWSEAAEVDALSGPFGQAPEDVPRPPGEVERTSDDEQLRPDGADDEGDVLPDSIPSGGLLVESAANEGDPESTAIEAPAMADSEPEQGPPELVVEADERETEAETELQQAAVAVEQVTDEVGADRSEATPPDEVPVALAVPEPVPPASSSRSPGAIRQAALLTHDDLPPPKGDVEPGAQTVFTVRCLGRFEMRLGAAPIEHWPLEKSRELLAFLATQGGAAVPRESVAEAMWPEYPWDASLRHLVANAVSGLRRVVRSAADDDEPQPVVTARQRYQLQTSLFRIDLDSFESSLRRAAGLPDVDALEEYERATTLYRGDFLEGELFPWLDTYRSDYRQRLIDGASRAAAIAERLDERARAERLYQVILEQEPTDEEAARGRMRHLAAAGDINGARKVFKALTEALQQELDDPRAGPASETKTLLGELVAKEEGGVA